MKWSEELKTSLEPKFMKNRARKESDRCKTAIRGFVTH